MKVHEGKHINKVRGSIRVSRVLKRKKDIYGLMVEVECSKVMIYEVEPELWQTLNFMKFWANRGNYRKYPKKSQKMVNKA